MSTLTWLVSDTKREFCDLGQIMFSESFVKLLKQTSPENLVATIAEPLISDPEGWNFDMPTMEAWNVATRIAAWISTHPDWRFLVEGEDAYYDIYLAEDDEDAKDYTEECDGEDIEPIYTKTGNVWE